ncbi:exodeoxyribonuclease VII small subunit [Deinococcus yavapaiensis]|uniref:Exodeoxyribonuclease VII small subunit n=1 Tax=Deinococcus yavapaiensis KR-236 TaxID=694435 RepID=A0A318S984_9DEIO|nr:exodeoxyribonuclease VII small subunit [Deinococcus yavapaiensis]PYE55275.1 exodeoxyribonuclease VII small subunit [Deinococcus yavapaiensis KR-236]
MSDYRRHYDTLARIAAELESGDADLDRVLPLLEEAKAAYEACKTRIEAVRRALGEDFDEVEALTEEDEDEE